MSELATARREDRGLAVAYERWCFAQRLAGWVEAFQATSALEGPLDGIDGIAGVHGVSLAARGLTLTSAVASDAEAEIARAVYAAGAPGVTVDVRVTATSEIGALPQADLVIAYRALAAVADVEGYLRALAGRAKKALIVVVDNPAHWARRGGVTAADGDTPALARIAWALGRVRDHAYFDAPWWPETGAARGALRSRAGAWLFARAGVAPDADRFVYGPERWPHQGGDGWATELLPALRGAPSLEGRAAGTLRRFAHRHAFVVDVRPRTPQARRRLATAR
jgi:hypothetical protein